MDKSKQNSYKMLNLGCGDTFHEDWINLDISDHDGKTIQYDLNLGIPFADDSFDFVYHSHIIEHFKISRARYFLKECFRVLKDGATLRIAFPDLEGIARNYLKSIQDIKDKKDGASIRRKWMALEMYDQSVRNRSGGEEFLKFFIQDTVPEKDFIISRWGENAKLAISYYEKNKNIITESPMPAVPCLNSECYKNGELHQWMYDFYALKKILSDIGFTNIQRQTFSSSSFEEYLKYNFDKDENGNIRKPDSAFIEATKPQNLNKKKRLRVAIFNSYDHGGAAIAALRKHDALRKHGINSEFYTAIQRNIKESVHLIPTKNNGLITTKRGEAFKENFLNVLSERNNQKRAFPEKAYMSQFDFTLATTANPKDIPLFDEFDIVNFEWVAGFADPTFHPEYFKDIPIVWTLHDMLAITGNCHVSEHCEKYKTGCGGCHHLCSQNPYDLSAQTFKKKLEAYKNLNIHFVTPSNWMAKQVKESGITSNFPVHVIHNTHPLDIFKPLENREAVRKNFGILPNDIVLLYTTDSFDVEIKGGKYLIELLQKLEQSELASKIITIILGNHIPDEIKNLKVRTAPLGFISGEKKLANIYNMADAVVVPSLEDNFPNVVCESLACGTPIVGFKTGGIPEMVEHLKTGFLAEKRNIEELFQGIKWLASVHNNQDIRQACRNFAIENLAEEKIAKQYEELYLEILKEKEAKFLQENIL